MLGFESSPGNSLSYSGKTGKRENGNRVIQIDGAKHPLKNSCSHFSEALFRILTKPENDMTENEKGDVKIVARKLLQILKQTNLVSDWRKKQRTRGGVYSTVKTNLDELPRVYTPELFNQKCEKVYQHVYDNNQGEGVSVYWV